MEYISAEWVVDEQMGTRVIKAIGDDGQTYWVPEADSDVPPWPEFLAKNGVTAIREPTEGKSDG
jgi:hypothetical protein